MPTIHQTSARRVTPQGASSMMTILLNPSVHQKVLCSSKDPSRSRRVIVRSIICFWICTMVMMAMKKQVEDKMNRVVKALRRNGKIWNEMKKKLKRASLLSPSDYKCTHATTITVNSRETESGERAVMEGLANQE